MKHKLLSLLSYQSNLDDTKETSRTWLIDIGEWEETITAS